MAGGAVLRAATPVCARRWIASRRRWQPANGRAPTFAEIAEEAWWHVHRLPAGEGPGLAGDRRLHARQHDPGARRERPHELRRDVRRAHDRGRGRGRSRDRPRARARRGARLGLRCGDQSDGRRGPAPGRVRAGTRRGAARGGALRRRGPAAHVDAHRLRDPRGARRAAPARRAPRDAVVGRRADSAGVGEAAIIATPAVIAGAVADALAPLGVEITSTRLHPHVLRAAIRAAGLRARRRRVRGRADCVSRRAAAGSRARARRGDGGDVESGRLAVLRRAISPPTATNAARVDRPVSTRPASGIVHADAIDRVHVPGREVGLHPGREHAEVVAAEAAARSRASPCAAARAPTASASGSSGSVPRCASAAMRRSPSRLAPSFDALPGGAEAERDARVEVRAHRRAAPAHAQVGRDQVRDRRLRPRPSRRSRPAGGSTTCASQVRGCAQPCSTSSSHGVRP